MHATTTPFETPTPSALDSGLAAVDALLRDRAGLLDRIDRREGLTALARTFALTLVAGAAVVGATIGAFRGGLQVPFAALKLPLVVLLTAGLCAPAYSALAAAVRGHTDVRRDMTVILASLALGALLLSALAPVLLLAVFLGMGYHALALLFAATCLVAGAGGLTLFVAAERRREGPGGWLITPVLLAVFALVGSQVSWTLRPYLVRPRAVEVPFVRAVEGSLFEAVLYSTGSALGRFRRDRAPMPGERGAGVFAPRRAPGRSLTVPAKGTTEAAAEVTKAAAATQVTDTAPADTVPRSGLVPAPDPAIQPAQPPAPSAPLTRHGAVGPGPLMSSESAP